MLSFQGREMSHLIPVQGKKGAYYLTYREKSLPDRERDATTDLHLYVLMRQKRGGRLIFFTSPKGERAAKVNERGEPLLQQLGRMLGPPYNQPSALPWRKKKKESSCAKAAQKRELS